MSKEIGRLQKIGIGKETSRGSAVAPDFWIPVDTKALNPKVEVKMKDGAYGHIEKSVDAEITGKHSEPEFNGILFDKSIGLLFLAGFGSLSTDADTPEAGVHTHNFSVLNDNQHPSLTVAMKDGNVGKSAVLSVMNTFELNIVLDDYIRFSAAFMAKQVADASLTPVFTDENHFVARHASVKTAADLSGLDAAEVINIQRITLTLTKNAEIVRKLGSDDPDDVINKELEISGSFEAIFDDTTYLDYLLNNTIKALRIEVESGVTIGSTSHPKFIIDLARVNFNPWSQDNANPDVRRQTIEFTGHFSLADSKSITAKLINAHASY